MLKCHHWLQSVGKTNFSCLIVYKPQCWRLPGLWPSGVPALNSRVLPGARHSVPKDKRQLGNNVVTDYATPQFASTGTRNARMLWTKKFQLENKMDAHLKGLPPSSAWRAWAEDHTGKPLLCARLMSSSFQSFLELLQPGFLLIAPWAHSIKTWVSFMRASNPRTLPFLFYLTSLCNYTADTTSPLGTPVSAHAPSPAAASVYPCIRLFFLVTDSQGAHAACQVPPTLQQRRLEPCQTTHTQIFLYAGDFFGDLRLLEKNTFFF